MDSSKMDFFVIQMVDQGMENSKEIPYTEIKGGLICLFFQRNCL